MRIEMKQVNQCKDDINCESTQVCDHATNDGGNDNTCHENDPMLGEHT